MHKGNEFECESHDIARYLKWSFVQWHEHRITFSYTVMSNTRSWWCWQNCFCVLGHESTIKNRSNKNALKWNKKLCVKNKAKHFYLYPKHLLKINIKLKAQTWFSWKIMLITSNLERELGNKLICQPGGLQCVFLRTRMHMAWRNPFCL